MVGANLFITPVHLAALNPNPQILKKFIEKGGDTTIYDDNGALPLVSIPYLALTIISFLSYLLLLSLLNQIFIVVSFYNPFLQYEYHSIMRRVLKMALPLPSLLFQIMNSTSISKATYKRRRKNRRLKKRRKKKQRRKKRRKK